MTPAKFQTFSDQLQHHIMLEKERLAYPKKSTIAKNNEDEVHKSSADPHL